MTVEEVTNEHIRRVLSVVPNVQDASRILEIDAATIYRRKRRMSGKHGPAERSPEALNGRGSQHAKNGDPGIAPPNPVSAA